ncbi:MAG: hypothetical protein R6W66_10700 [Pelovirga sp.]|jgi:flagellar motility protein MotE (MotC chaperone)
MKHPLLRLLSLAVIGLLLFHSAGGAATLDTPYTSVEERRIITAIDAEHERLEERRAALDRRELQLNSLAAEVDKKIAAMQSLRDELDRLLARRNEEDTQRLSELSLIYERMNPQQAAVLIGELETELAVSLLLGIRKKTAGQIMERLDPETAIRLSRAFTDRSPDGPAQN